MINYKKVKCNAVLCDFKGIWRYSKSKVHFLVHEKSVIATHSMESCAEVCFLLRPRDICWFSVFRHFPTLSVKLGKTPFKQKNCPRNFFVGLKNCEVATWSAEKVDAEGQAMVCSFTGWVRSTIWPTWPINQSIHQQISWKNKKFICTPLTHVKLFVY